MKEAYIISSVRTPGCRNRKGKFKDTRPEDLLSHVMAESVKRAGIEPSSLNDIVCGCAFPEGEQGLNIGRIAGQKAGFPFTVTGVTMNRFCSSGLEAIATAASKIAMGWDDITMGAGVESMTYVPMGGHSPRPHPEFAFDYPENYISMGITAEIVAEKYNVSRKDQDEFAAMSHQKAEKAQKEGKFPEIVSTPAYTFTLSENGTYEKVEYMVDADDGVRLGTTAESISHLNSPFKLGGSVTAGNSSQTTDGAAATVLASREICEANGIKPIAKIKGYAVAGCRADEMGVGPAYAIPKVLKQTGLTIDDIDIIELNEAFASQSIYCLRELGIYGTEKMEKVNRWGGAIALGHPLGCTGAKLTATCLAQLQDVKGRFGIVSMCIGGGMGAACVYEMI